MPKSIVETIIKGSNREFLNIPIREYNSKYNEVNIESAQLCSNEYFESKRLYSSVNVLDVEVEPEFDNVKITIEVDEGDRKSG